MKANRKLLVVAIVLTFALTNCLGGGGGSGGSSGSNGGGEAALSTTTQTRTSDGSGSAQFSFTVNPGTSAVQLIASTTTQSINLTSLTGPGGNLLADDVTEVSTALSAQLNADAFSFPTLQNSVAPGNYTASYFVKSRSGQSGQAGASVTMSAVQKDTSTPGGGTVTVNIVLVGPTAGSQNTIDSIGGCVEVWQSIFSKANLTLDVQYYNFDGPNMIPNVQVGDPFYAQISSAVRPNAINMVVGVDVTGATGQENQDFGLVGGIPGSILPGPKSAVAFSIIRVAGEDGRFNYDGPGAVQKWKDEVEVGGEVMAFLAAEYMGLQPAVQLQGDKVIAADRIPDTATCVTETECKNEDEPRENFMFPRVYMKPGTVNDTYGRTNVTSDQAAFMQQSIFVH